MVDKCALYRVGVTTVQALTSLVELNENSNILPGSTNILLYEMTFKTFDSNSVVLATIECRIEIRIHTVYATLYNVIIKGILITRPLQLAIFVIKEIYIN